LDANQGPKTVPVEENDSKLFAMDYIIKICGDLVAFHCK
jgi:hypothetical protein